MSTVVTVLASSSPSRLSLLRQAGIEPVVIRPEVDEHAVVERVAPGSVVEEVALLAQTKASAVINALAQDPHEGLIDSADTCVLIACDSLLELDGESVGKPGNAQATTEVWKRLRGKSAVLHSGHSIALLRRGSLGWSLVDQEDAVGSTTIRTAHISDEEIVAYCETGEPFHVAGALTIDGYGSAFVESLEGDHTNVIGLSIPLARTLVTKLGVSWPDLWKITST
ncbi:Maf family protein [Brevibacterium paucivorans]